MSILEKKKKTEKKEDSKLETLKKPKEKRKKERKVLNLIHPEDLQVYLEEFLLICPVDLLMDSIL